METKLEKKQKRTCEEKVITFLDHYDNWKAGIFPGFRSKRAVQKIAVIWMKEIKNRMREDAEVDTFTLYFAHPVDTRYQLAANEWCLFPFAYNFKSPHIHGPLGTYMWTTYGKHPAYAVPDMSEDDLLELASALKWELLELGYDYSANVISDEVYHHGIGVPRMGIQVRTLRRA